MQTTMDSAGRIVIPKALREGAGLRPGAPLEIELVRGGIQILPAVAKTRIVDEGGVAVLLTEAGDTVTAEAVRRIQEALRGPG